MAARWWHGPTWPGGAWELEGDADECAAVALLLRRIAARRTATPPASPPPASPPPASPPPPPASPPAPPASASTPPATPEWARRTPAPPHGGPVLALTLVRAFGAPSAEATAPAPWQPERAPSPPRGGGEEGSGGCEAGTGRAPHTGKGGRSGGGEGGGEGGGGARPKRKPPTPAGGGVVCETSYPDVPVDVALALEPAVQSSVDPWDRARVRYTHVAPVAARDAAPPSVPLFDVLWVDHRPPAKKRKFKLARVRDARVGALLQAAARLDAGLRTPAAARAWLAEVAAPDAAPAARQAWLARLDGRAA